MSIYISSAVVVSDDYGLTANNPVVGYQNLVTAAGTTADTEETGFPASNVANNNTALRWQSAGGSPTFSPEYVTFDISPTDNVDYVGIAGHNFHTGQIAVSIEAGPDGASPAEWDTLAGPVIPPNDGPLIFRFVPGLYDSIRICLLESTNTPATAARMSVVYIGKLLILQRRIYVGHTPLKYGRVDKVVNLRAEAGHFLGRVTLNSKRTSSVEMQNLTPDWYRSEFEPFVEYSRENPFFFNWRPSDYPFESGFAWTTGDIRPQNQLANGMMSVSINMGGISS